MSGDLLGGRFPLTYPIAKALGLPSNAVQGNLSARSNLESGFLGSLQDAAAALVSGKITLVPVPVEVGDEISAIDVLAGATAAVTPTHSWAALYNAAGVLVGGQSADGVSAAIAASARFSFALGTKYIVSSADAPNGYLYAGVSVTAATVPSLVSGTVPTACQYAWFTTTTAFQAATSGSSLGASAPASITLGSATSQAAAPVVFLR